MLNLHFSGQETSTQSMDTGVSRPDLTQVLEST